MDIDGASRSIDFGLHRLFRLLSYNTHLSASANKDVLGVPSSPATSEPQKRASAFPGTRRRELLPGEALEL